jgi:hypothetical protein
VASRHRKRCCWSGVGFDSNSAALTLSVVYLYRGIVALTGLGQLTPWGVACRLFNGSACFVNGNFVIGNVAVKDGIAAMPDRR